MHNRAFKTDFNGVVIFIQFVFTFESWGSN